MTNTAGYSRLCGRPPPSLGGIQMAAGCRGNRRHRLWALTTSAHWIPDLRPDGDRSKAAIRVLGVQEPSTFTRSGRC